MGLINIPFEYLLLGASALLLLSVFASKISDKFGVPALLIFLGIGMLAGSEGLGRIQFDEPWLAKSIGVVALIFIIFSGGIDTVWKDAKSVLLPGVILASIGVFLTAVIVGCFAVLVLKFSFLEGLLLGSIVSSTDAAAVFSILRSKRVSLKGSLRPLLELESGSNDPMAVFLTIAVIYILSSGKGQLTALLPMLIFDMGIGAIMGYIMGRFSVFVINLLRLEYRGLYPALSFSLVLLTYSATTALRGNGFLAVYIVGLVMGSREFLHRKTIVHFHEGTAWLMQIIMFLALGLLVFPSRLIAIAKPALLIAGTLMLVARPLSVFLCLLPFKINIKKKVMVSWVGLRGAVPIILATFPLLAGVKEANTIFNIVFFIVLTSVLIQGTSVPFVSRLLGVVAPLLNKRRYPIQFEKMEGTDANLTDIIVPYNAGVAGRAIVELGVPPDALIVLISRGDRFIVPNGSTVIEGGDVVLVLANPRDLAMLQNIFSQFTG